MGAWQPKLQHWAGLITSGRADAFKETILLPAETLKRAFEHRDPYNPHPLWLNFRGLFRAIDEGNAGLNI